METHKINDIVSYRNETYIITKVWNHGGRDVYYDLEREYLGIIFVELSVYHYEIFIHYTKKQQNTSTFLLL